MMKANIDKLGDDDGKLEASDGLSAVVKLGVVIVALVFIRNYMLATKIRAHLKNSRELERANQTYQDMVVELNSKVVHLRTRVAHAAISDALATTIVPASLIRHHSVTTMPSASLSHDARWRVLAAIWRSKNC
mmetsp:Transcript_107136/g.311095  ORF Transcript_107136/g.311095 Transcript_107136/m.311095 type:complete len:133 (-) Transcript_107136:1162-1560(-)